MARSNVSQAISAEKTLPSGEAATHTLARRWFLVFSAAYGTWIVLPFLAPVFMQIGWETPGRMIYALYSFFCHQLPQRSFFLFGPQGMYSVDVIRQAWQDTLDPMILRQFIGSPALGWKVAWSDRMVSMYSSILLFAWLWVPLRKRVKPLAWWGLLLFLLPMGVDGVTHFFSDFAGIGQGFRDSNLWLATLTNNAFDAGFYAGDALGSFNSWMRLITGLLFGLGIVWFSFSYLEESFGEVSALKEQLRTEYAGGLKALENQGQATIDSGESKEQEKESGERLQKLE